MKIEAASTLSLNKQSVEVSLSQPVKYSRRKQSDEPLFAKITVHIILYLPSVNEHGSVEILMFLGAYSCRPTAWHAQFSSDAKRNYSTSYWRHLHRQ